MNIGSFVDYAVVIAVLAVCAFLIVRSAKRTVSGDSSLTGCSSCSEKKNCGK